MPKRVQSPSSINTYNQCPRKYYYQYILKLPTSPSIHLVRGNIAHSVLEDFFSITHLTLESVMEEGFETFALKLLRQYWKKHEEELDKLDLTEQQLEFYLIETVQMIRNWVNHFTFKHDMLVEQGLSHMDAFLKLKPKCEVYYKDEELWVQGFIDAIHEEGEHVKIIDYKTSKHPKISPEYYLQLGIYALMYERKHGKRPQEVGIFFLKDTEHTIPVTDELIKNAQQKIEAIHLNTEDFSAKEDYPKKPSGLCKWSTGQCDFYDKCFPNGR